VSFRNTFNGFKRSTKIVLVMSFVLGVVLLVSFSLTDAGVNVTLGSFGPKPAWLKRYNAEWFQSHAYIPNVLAGFTGFLIGAPVPVVVLDTFTVEREDRAAINKVNQISALAWDQFKHAIHEFCSTERIFALTDQTGLVQKIQNEALQVFQDYKKAAPMEPVMPGYPALRPGHPEQEGIRLH
jgi:hypothetical protein